MPSLWGKEFLVFVNLLKYAAIVALAVYFVVYILRLARREPGGKK